MPRHLTRLDDDNYQAFREQAFRSGTDSTTLINTMLRYALPLAAAGVFNLPHETIFAALRQYQPPAPDPVPPGRPPRSRESVRNCQGSQLELGG